MQVQHIEIYNSKLLNSVFMHAGTVTSRHGVFSCYISKHIKDIPVPIFKSITFSVMFAEQN